MPNDLITDERKKLNDAILKALQVFSSATSLKVDEIKINVKDLASDMGKDFFYVGLDFKMTL